MTKERLSAILRWAGIVLAGSILVVVLSARGPGGPQRGAGIGPLAPAGSGQSSLVAAMVTNPAAADISGPYSEIIPAASSSTDLSKVPYVRPKVQPAQAEEAEAGTESPTRAGLTDPVVQTTRSSQPNNPSMPAPLQTFDGLDFATYGSAWPPDTNGDVGPVYYVQTVNSTVGIFTKTTGLLAKAISFNDLWALATVPSGTDCDHNNKGDPVALYDAKADRFIVSDFAYSDTAHATHGPYFECVAASQTNNPMGLWNYYAIRTDDDAHRFFGDYPKLGVWPDGIYLSVNRFDCQGNLTCNPLLPEGARVWALNRDDLYSGAALRAQYFDLSSAYSGLLPSNFKGVPPPVNTPNYFVSNQLSLSNSKLDVFKFHVDWVITTSSYFTGPILITIDPFTTPPHYIPEPAPDVAVDSVGFPIVRLMMQNQYRNTGGDESLWVTHTADDAPTGVRWYQLNVSGGTVSTTPVQQGTYKPDNNYRWMPSLAVDKSGNMAIGYSVSSSSLHPAIYYAGRLVTDPVGTLGQGETTLISGGGGEKDCGCQRWGDYSAMTVDPIDDCTFWYTTEYFAADGDNWQTRIGSFKFPSCGTPVTQTLLYLPNVQKTIPPPTGWTTIMQESFEGAWPSAGWTVTDFGSNTYIWAKRNCAANGDSFSAWAMGGGSSGSGLSCGANYIDNANSWAIFGPFSLAGATAAQFNLQVSVNTEPFISDSLCRSASVDNNNFFGTCTFGNTGGFAARTLDLSNVPGAPLGGDFRGQSSVWIAVVFRSDGSGNLPNGGFVDDLLLRKCLAATCAGQAPSSAGPDVTGGNVHEVAVKLTRPTK